MAREQINPGQSIRDRMRQNLARGAGGANYLKTPTDTRWFKPEAKTMIFDIVPYEITVDNCPNGKAGELWYERRFDLCRNVGPTRESFISPRSIGQPCPIWEQWSQLRQTEGVSKELLSAVVPKSRQLFNIFDHRDMTIRLWENSFHNFGSQLNDELKGDESLWDFFDLGKGKGLSLKVRFAEESFAGKPFLVATRIDFIARTEPLLEDVLDEVYDLDSLLIIPDYDTLKEASERGLPAEPAAGRRGRDEGPSGGEGGGRGGDEPPRRRQESSRVEIRDEVEPQEPERGKRGTRSEPEPEPSRRAAREPRAEEVNKGDRVSWDYRNEKHVGEVSELLPDGAIRVIDDADGRIKLIDAGDYTPVSEVQDDRPRRRQPAPEPDPQTQDDPPRRPSRQARDDDEPPRPSEARHGSSGDGWPDDGEDDPPRRGAAPSEPARAGRSAGGDDEVPRRRR